VVVVIGRWWRGRRQDRHAMLVMDIARTRGYMRAVIAEARALDVPVPPVVVVATAAWGEWLEHLTRPIEDDLS
jgi:hypothetical protein